MLGCLFNVTESFVMLALGFCEDVIFLAFVRAKEKQH
jgi:hypothetical protein